MTQPAATPFDETKFKEDSVADMERSLAAIRDIGEGKMPPPRAAEPQPYQFKPRLPHTERPATVEPYRTPAVAAPSGSDIERFMATGEKMLDAQRKKILALESTNEFDRVKLIDDYRVKLRDLEHEANEALRSFDLKHNTELAEAKRILDALTAMRG